MQNTIKVNSVVAMFSHMSDEVHIRPKDCAQILGISIATFWRLTTKNGQLKTHKLTPRTTTVKAGDLRAFMAGKAES